MFHIKPSICYKHVQITYKHSGRDLVDCMNERKVEMDHPGLPVVPAQPPPCSMKFSHNFPFTRSHRAIYGFPVHNGGQHLRFQDLVSGYLHNVLREHDVIGSFAGHDRTQDVIGERGVSGIDSYS